MDITLILRYFTIGGLERVVSSLANGYVKRGHNVKIIVLSKGKRNSLITEIDPRVEVIFLEGKIWSKIRQIREKTKNSIVHIHFGDGKIHPFIRLGLSDRKTIITYHSVYSHKRNFLLNLIDRLFSFQAKKIIAVSDAVKDFCVNEVKIKKDKICVIRNGIEYNGDMNEREKGKTLKIVSLASLYPHKNQMYLIRSLAALKMKYPISFELYIIGDGPCMSDLYLESIKLGLKENITWYGAVWQKDLVDSIVQKADIFVSASKYEGFPISILEGMTYGLPMLLSNILPHKEMCGEGALFFDFEENYGSFIDGINKIYADNDYAKRMSDYSYHRVKEYDVAQTIEQYLGIYDRYR